ncbi:MAG TPA: hypothetical protein VIJ57_13355 [Hanamia sp.]
MNKIITTQFSFSQDPYDFDLLLLAAGFEDRAFNFLSNSDYKTDAHCILIEFLDRPELNKDIFNNYLNKAKVSFAEEKIHIVQLGDNIQLFEKNLNEQLLKLPRSINNTWIDISGMPTHTICITLNSVRTLYPTQSQKIIYSAAESYFPTFEEYTALSKKSDDNEEFVPKTMTMEMSEVLILETFSGHRSKEGISCLAVFPGYDANRTGGVIDSINPSMLLFLFGDPNDSDLKWRANLSRQLHRKFESTRKCAVEAVSTLDPNQSLNVLDEYYEFLFEDYDFTIAPLCSKMQVVGTFLFWERYKEVQLVFPLPVGYDVDKKPVGTSATFITMLEPRSSLYRSSPGTLQS